MQTFPLAFALPAFQVSSETARRVGRFGALLLALIFSAPLAAALADNNAAHASPPLASPAPARLTHLAQATTENSSIPAAVLPKLDAQIVLGLKKSRGEPPYDKAAAAEPDIPIKQGNRVLVDIDATVSTALLQDIAASEDELAAQPRRRTHRSRDDSARGGRGAGAPGGRQLRVPREAPFESKPLRRAPPSPATKP